MQVGIDSFWQLPEVFEGPLSLKEIRIEPDPLLSKHISFDAPSRTVFFNGKVLLNLKEEKFLTQMSVTLVDSLGGETTNKQMVIVFPEEIKK